MSGAMELEFHTLDVFTAEPLGGNPLAVVLGADGLSDQLMQQVAREFNLSETVFVGRSQQSSRDAVPVRIFTPRNEFPFAGHPVIGTAVLLAELQRKDACAFETELTLATKAGPVPLTVTRIGGPARAQFTAPRLAVSSDSGLADPAVAAAIGLEPDEIGCRGHRPRVLTGTAAIVAVPVKNTAALGKAAAVDGAWQPLRKATGSIGIYAYTALPTPAAWRVRFFVPDQGIAEDPATGLAAAAFPAQVLTFDRPGDGTLSLSLEQGIEMGRPSLIAVEVDVRSGTQAAVRVAGQAVRVTSGTMRL
jgi:trans-2,3-dihydro-3-hydroxyanthranilate isomerase